MMNELDLEQKKNRILYRELFLKANDGFKEQINNLKVRSFCQNCKACCKIRYTGFSPAEIYQLAQEKDSISVEYMRLFLPYGAEETFDYKKNSEIDLKLNNDKALEVNEKYVDLILSKLPGPVYFYFCKYLNEDDKCTLTDNRSFLCDGFPSSITTVLPKECGFREWQKQAVDKIKNEMSLDVLEKIKEINLHRNNFECKKTGVCCRLACSEFSYEDLKNKAKNGDNFAGQFTSIFIPYENIEEARAVFPEYVELVESHLDADEKIYFYHCPDVTDDNLCSRYETRPQICREFPNNPLAILPITCGFREWKDEVQVAAMLLHAIAEILEFNLDKIENALKD